MRSSYANEKSNLITVSFDEDKNTSRVVIAVLLIFLLSAVPLSMFTWSYSQPVIQSTSPGVLEPPLQGSNILDWSPTSNNQEARERMLRLSEGDSELSKPAGIAAESPNEGPRVGSKFPNVYWEEPQGGAHCLGFGTREYTAKLRNVPFYANGKKICEETEVSIHGVVLPRPTRCKRRVRR
jgi:hypothetical protein